MGYDAHAISFSNTHFFLPHIENTGWKPVPQRVENQSSSLNVSFTTSSIVVTPS